MAQQMSRPGEYETDDPRLTALLLTLEYDLIGRSFTEQGRVSFRFRGVPPNILDRTLDASPEMLLLRRFVGNLEQVYAVLSQSKRERLR
jgi:hypothetical protein